MSLSFSDSPVQPAWPDLPYLEWKETYATLHMWTQIVGKIRLVRAPWINHSWHVPFYITARWLTSSPIPDGDAPLRSNSTSSITVCASAAAME